MLELKGLKVCFLAGTLGQGGAERQLYYMLRALKRAGARPRVLCLSQNEHWQERIEALGVPVTWVGESRFRLRRLAKIVNELKNDLPDIFQSQHFYTNIYVTSAARVLGLPEIGALRSDGIGELGANHGLLGRWSLKTPRLIAANSHAGIENAVALGAPRERLFFLPNVVDTSLFTPSSSNDTKSVRLLTVGRMVPVKRFDRFIRAVAAVGARSEAAIRGLIVGDGPLRSALESQASELGLGPDKLSFCGTAEETGEFYRESDLLLLTSDREGTPNVVLEAMASGIPVVATSVGGLPALVRDGKTGYLVDPHDEAAFADAVLDLVNDRDKRIAFGRCAREFVEHHHDLPQLEIQLGRLYEAALSQRSAVAPATEQPVKKLLVVTNVIHYRHRGQLFGYGPYALEMHTWGKIFPNLVLAAPYRNTAPPGDCSVLPDNIKVVRQPETGGVTVNAKLRQLAMLPYSIVRLCIAMWGVDAVHVRCPGNLGLLGVVISPLFHRKRVAKFAGQWDGYDGEPWTVRLQRWLLRSHWWNAPVMVYTEKKNEPKHIVPFFTSAITSSQMTRACASSIARPATRPARVLYAGRLSKAKNVHVLLNAVAAVLQDGEPLTCTIVGEGPERDVLENLAERLGIKDRVVFTGGLSSDAVLDHYEAADVLVLASETEGWPKTITEGMAFGLVCIGSDRGLTRTMLAEGRGYVVEPGNTNTLAAALRDACRMSPQELSSMRGRATKWSSQFTTEHFRDSLRDTLEDRWRAPKERHFRAPRSGTVGTAGTKSHRIGVMHLTDTLEIGGAERMAVSLANALPRGQFAPHVCTTRRSGPLSDAIEADVGQLSLNRQHTLDFNALWRLIRYIRKNDIHILHAHGTAVFVSAAASMFWPYPRLVWHIHYGRHAAKGSSGWQYRAIRRRIGWSIAVSEPLAGWANKIVGIPTDRVEYIPNFSTSSLGPTAHVDLPGEPGMRIVCVANFLPEKDHLTLVRAMEKVVRAQPRAQLLLVGGGKTSQWGKAVVSEIERVGLGNNVSLLGQRRDVPGILEAADIGVLSSEVEGLPLALIEYGQAALPVVVTAVGQCPDVIDYGKAGIIVEPRNDDEIAGAILRLLASSRERTRLGHALQKRVHERFNAAKCVDNIYATYHQVLSANAR
jgi:glycosyltransferase involved in cell wall biosynthesis